MKVSDIDSKVNSLQSKRNNDFDRYMSDKQEYLPVTELKRLMMEYRVLRHEYQTLDEFEISFKQEFEPWGRASEMFEDVWYLKVVSIPEHIKKDGQLVERKSLFADEQSVLTFKAKSFMNLISAAKFFFIELNEQIKNDK